MSNRSAEIASRHQCAEPGSAPGPAPAGARAVLARERWLALAASTAVLSSLGVPVVRAPMAGGPSTPEPSTPELAAAVGRGGGLGFLAGGYQSAARLAADIAALRAAGIALGEPRFDDDARAEKVRVLTEERAVVVSFTFGLPAGHVVDALHAAGSEAWLTVTSAAAAAGQVGTAYSRSIEAGTAPVHRDAVASERRSVLTRAFSGRLARGIANRWDELYGQYAPHAYPEVHHRAAPLRAHGRQAGDPDLVNLWAGQAHSLARTGSAEDITRDLARDARAALADAAALFRER